MTINVFKIWYNIKYIILVLLVLTISGSAMSNVFPVVIPCLAILGILFVVPLVLNLIHEKLEILLFLSIYAIVFLLSAVVNPGNIKYIVMAALFLLISYAMVRTIDIKKFLHVFIIFMTVMASISIVCYFLMNYIHMHLPFKIVTNSRGISYGIGYIFNYLIYIKDRNCGMFWEPGIMATYLIISLILKIIVFPRRKNIAITVILLAALVFTNSSAGAMLLLLYIAFVLFYRLGRSNASAVQLVILSLVIFSILVFALEYNNLIELLFGSNQKLANKLLTDNMFSSQRMRALVLWWNNFLSHPIFGTSITSISENFVWDTSTSTMFLGLFGFLGAIYSIGWIIGISKLQINLPCKIILGIIIFCIINKESHANFMFSWILMFTFLCYGSVLSEETEGISKRNDLLNNKDSYRKRRKYK